MACSTMRRRSGTPSWFGWLKISRILSERLTRAPLFWTSRFLAGMLTPVLAVQAGQAVAQVGRHVLALAAHAAEIVGIVHHGERVEIERHRHILERYRGSRRDQKSV